MFSSVKKYFRLFFLRRKWRRSNAHNQTSVLNIFPINRVKVGKNTYGSLNIHSYCDKSNGLLTIGNFVSISPGVLFILDGNHHTSGFTTFPLASKFNRGQRPIDATSKGPITVEDEVWIGTNSIVMSGVTIGKNSIVAAGSVVIKDVAPFSIVGGNPAKFIKYRIPESLIQELLPYGLVDLSEQQQRKLMDSLYTAPTSESIKEIFKDHK